MNFALLITSLVLVASLPETSAQFGRFGFGRFGFGRFGIGGFGGLGFGGLGFGGLGFGGFGGLPIPVPVAVPVPVPAPIFPPPFIGKRSAGIYIYHTSNLIYCYTTQIEELFHF